MDKELQEADDKYIQAIAAISPEWTEAARLARMTSLKNGNASKKSQIRKSYGVTLRMRERDKQARKSSGMSTPPTNPRLEEYRAQPLPRPNSVGLSGPPGGGTPTGTPPVSGFSPINKNNGPGPIPPTGTGNPKAPWGPSVSIGQYQSQYRPPPINAAQRVQNSFTIPHPNTLTHALESQPAPGFGVLRPTNPPINFQQVSGTKRRRTSEDVGEPRAAPASNSSTSSPSNQGQDQGLAMLPVRVEDAASKYPRKTPLLPGQMRQDVPMTEAPSSSAAAIPAPTPVGTKEAAITIISSSESEDGAKGGGSVSE
jgi:hypothetical protein